MLPFDSLSPGSSLSWLLLATPIEIERHSGVIAVDPGGVDQQFNISLALGVQLDVHLEEESDGRSVL